MGFNRNTLAHMTLVIVQICFSGWHIIGHLALKSGANPFVFALYREFVASVLMYGVVFAKGLQIDIEREDYFRFCTMGVCSFTNVVGTMLALVFISPTRYAIFQPCIPVIATALSMSIGLEKFTMMKGAGILVAVGGKLALASNIPSFLQYANHVQQRSYHGGNVDAQWFFRRR